MSSSFCHNNLNFLRNLITRMKVNDMPRGISDDTARLVELHRVDEAELRPDLEIDPTQFPELSNGAMQPLARNENVSRTHNDKPVMSFMYSMFAIAALSVAGLNSAFPYMYNALTVGFCGSFTTFSSWIYSTMHGGNALIELGTGFTIPFAAFALGRDVGSNVSMFVSGQTLAFDKIMVYAVVLCAVSTLVLLLASNSTSPTETITNACIIACALGPIGALTRWIMGKYLNDRIVDSSQKKTFRLGTLTSNVIAVIITGALEKYGARSQWAWYISTGICGSLSTVSSWVADTVCIYESVSKKWAYFYCAVSVSACILIMIPFAR